ncbi:hypothetical protein CKC_04425 [Candidatus Liberibacter solanacearum CLso-ZC1]|uniref:Lipoprotein n=1 Tax=Liberibacter solanacearum (strain CLso-ZC1) TaxID=658172 RepID=E4UDF6_LIBSC|nr:small effector proten [Candidatus Liberibacter solanacearum]ADR52634.1 hypothetical protein CKC_04425 [Candidatus Liberibacter solanacearum CLso-ZC1]
MNIKKLGLISTVAMLSTAVSLGGCNNTKPKAAESAAKAAEVAKKVATAAKAADTPKPATDT